MSRTQRARVETLLLDFARRLAKQPQGWVAVVVAMTQLQPCHRREHHLAVVVDGFRRLERKDFGSCFELASGDVAFVGRQDHAPQVQDWLGSLNFLFRADPLCRAVDEDGRGRFCQWYDLAADYVEFLAYCERLAHAEAPGHAGAPARPLDAAGLLTLAEALGNLDARVNLRRRPVCLLTGGAAQMVFEDVTCPLAEIGRRVLPEVDLGSERNLAQYLKETLDTRVLEALAAGARGEPLRRIGLGISLAAVGGAAFERFDAAVAPRAHTSIVIAFRPADAFADLATFARVVGDLRERGYRVALDGLSVRALQFLDRAALGVDLVRLAWQEGQERVLDEGALAGLRAAVARAGPARVVLSGADSPPALALGRAVGIHLFSGRQAEAALAATTPAARRQA